MQATLLDYVTVVFRVCFLMLYLGALLSYMVNRRYIVRLSPVHRVLFAKEVVSKTSKLVLAYLTPSVAAGALFLLLAPNTVQSQILIAEGAVTVLMIISALVGLLIAYRFKKKSDVRVFISTLDYRFRWISVTGQKISNQNEKIFTWIVAASIILALTAIALGLLVNAVLA